jgi:hypothetical protein
MLSISGTDEWRNSHPGASIGLLELSGVVNTQPSPKLDEQKRATEIRLKERYQGFTRQDFLLEFRVQSTLTKMELADISRV